MVKSWSSFYSKLLLTCYFSLFVVLHNWKIWGFWDSEALSNKFNGLFELDSWSYYLLPCIGRYSRSFSPLFWIHLPFHFYYRLSSWHKILEDGDIWGVQECSSLSRSHFSCSNDAFDHRSWRSTSSLRNTSFNSSSFYSSLTWFEYSVTKMFPPSTLDPCFESFIE